MPVQIIEKREELISPFNRLSASQVNTHKRCPRAWWHEKVDGLKGPQPPILSMGKAVEDCLCRVLRESPVFIHLDAETSLFNTPIGTDGRPLTDELGDWPGPASAILPKHEWPSTIVDLLHWGVERVRKHFPISWGAARQNWETDPNKIGEWEDLDAVAAEEMVVTGLKMHLEEVTNCLNSNGGPLLSDWRTGEWRPECAPPDGFPPGWKKVHPAATEGDLTLMEAWEISRPWFVDPDATPFSLQTIHPDQWFQGEYDLIYRWDGTVRIIDIKASQGTSDYSQWYPFQLMTYAWLWKANHPDDKPVSELELWYLGAAKKHDIPSPKEEELDVLGAELKSLYTKLKTESLDIADFPPDPAPVRIHLPGGRLSEEPDLPGKVRCDDCNWNIICDSLGNRETYPNGGTYTDGGGRSINLTPLNEIQTRYSIEGEFFAIEHNPRWGDWEVRLSQGRDSISIVAKPGENIEVPAGLTTGSKLVLKDGIPSRYFNTPRLLMDSKSALTVTHAGDSTIEKHNQIIDIKTLANVRGIVISLGKWSGGKGDRISHQWRCIIADKRGFLTLVAWNNDIPMIAESLKRGDEVVAIRVEIGEYQTRAQGQLGRNSQLKKV